MSYTAECIQFHYSKRIKGEVQAKYEYTYNMYSYTYYMFKLEHTRSKYCTNMSRAELDFITQHMHIKLGLWMNQRFGRISMSLITSLTLAPTADLVQTTNCQTRRN